jgi:hypothetical protein
LPVTPTPPVIFKAPVAVLVAAVPLVMLAVAIFAPVKLPTEVMLGCAAVVTVPAVVAVGTVPVTLTVTAPVAPLTAMFVPATILVTPVLVIVTPVLPL